MVFEKVFLFKCPCIYKCKTLNFKIMIKNFCYFTGFDLIYFGLLPLLLTSSCGFNPFPPPSCYLRSNFDASEKHHVFLKCESENHPSGHAGIFLGVCDWKKSCSHFATLWLDERLAQKKIFFISILLKINPSAWNTLPTLLPGVTPCHQTQISCFLLCEFLCNSKHYCFTSIHTETKNEILTWKYSL